jgi:O-antigen ligase
MSSLAGGAGGRRPFAAAARTAEVGAERVALVATAAAVATLPLAVPSGPGNVVPADGFVAVAVAFTLLWAGRSGHLWRCPYGWAVALLVAGGAVGALAGPLPTVGLVALAQDLVLLAWCWAFVNIGHSAANLRTLLTTWVYAAFAWTVLLFVGLGIGSAFLTGQIERQGTRVALTLADPNYAANYLVVSIMIIWATARPGPRALRYVAYALMLAAIVLTGSNSGLVSLVVGVLVAALIGIGRRFGVAPAVAALALVVLSGFVVATSVTPTDVQDAAAGSRYSFVRDGLGRSESEAEYRGLLMREGWGLYLTGGLAGSGPVSTKVRLQHAGAPYVKEAHDDYLAALIERGLLGVLGLALLVASLGIKTVRTGTARLREAYRDVLVRPHALVGAVAGTLVSGTVYELFHVRHVWALFAIPAAVSIWGLARPGGEA